MQRIHKYDFSAMYLDMNISVETINAFNDKYSSNCVCLIILEYYS